MPGRRPWRPGTAPPGTAPGPAPPGAAAAGARGQAGGRARQAAAGPASSRAPQTRQADTPGPLPARSRDPRRPAPSFDIAPSDAPLSDIAPSDVPRADLPPQAPGSGALPAAFAGLPELSEADADDWDDAPPDADDAPELAPSAADLPLGRRPPDAEQVETGRVLFAAPCRFFYAAQRPDQLPEPRGPEIAFAGRSNVGKSSLINALANHHGLARASNQPGRTRQLNFFDLGERLTLVDMPGYGYAQAAKEVKRDWQGLMLDFLRGRPTLQRVVLLLDSRIELKGSDEAVMELLDLSAVTFQLVLTKTDGTKPAALARKLAQVRGYVREHAAAHPDIIATSSTTGAGIPELRAALATLALPKQ
jgi:GTP-binding protein